MSQMLQEIHEQPEVIARLIEKQRDNALRIGRLIRERGCRFAVMAARGTSDNAAIFAKYLFEIANGFPVALAAPSVFTLYDADLDLRDAVVFGISQSGQAVDVNEYLVKARKHGAMTIGITNVPGSPMCEASEQVIFCEAGEEKALAATKTYTATLGTIYLISAGLDGTGRVADGLMKAADAMRLALAAEDTIRSNVERYRYMKECFVVARGLNHATGFEIALKMAETSYIAAEPYSAADLMHGPIAVVDEGFPCFLVAPTGRTFDMMSGVARQLSDRKAEIIAISDSDELLSLAATPIRAPNDLDEVFTPIVYIVFGQIFAYYLALAQGCDPDRPRGLSKITLTR